jgi:tetratricopeptide (TPR) repeat protein
MHITAPLPRLPEPLSQLQPLLDRLLAKEPDHRLQHGRDVVAEVMRLERELSGVTSLMSVPAPMTRGMVEADLDGLESREPTLGRMDDVLRSPAPRRRSEARRQARGGGRGWLVGLALLGLVLAGAWNYQDELRGLLPQTRLNELLRDADQALVENRLTRPDGGGARELYSAVLALDPDNQPARQGLQRVGSRLLDSARTALANGDLDAARSALAQARELAVPAADADALEQSIAARGSRGIELGTLLEQARAARDAGRLDEGEASAVALYRRTLEIDPGNAVALAGLRDTLSAMLDRARALVVAGEYDTAAREIETVAAIDPAHLGLPDARGRLAEARTLYQTGVDAELEAGDALLKQGRLLSPAADNAQKRYRAALARDAGNARAREGLRRIASSLLGQAERQMADFEFERAATLIDQAQAVDAAAPGIGAARTRLRELQRRREDVAQPDPASLAAQQRIAELLEQARIAADAGNLLMPPGESAYDRYRAVRTIDPGNAQARAGMAKLPGLARQAFETAIGANRLSTARGAIDALNTLAPADGALPEMRRRLARSLLGQAAERLGAGEIQRASQAFDQARELDPTNSELPAMQARLEQASGGGK